MHRFRLSQWILAVGLLVPATSGCAFGPKQLERSHGRYAEAVNRVEGEELLLNFVLARYSEAPRALEVSAIAAQYEMSYSAEARPFFGTPNASNFPYRTFTSILPAAMVGGSDRPTVSMKPSLDGTAVRQFLTPISTDMLVYLTQSGWPVASVLRLWVERMNGVPNATPNGGPPRDSTTDFVRFNRIADLLQATHDKELLNLHGDDHFKEIGSPLPAEAVTSAAVVEAAKNGFEYRRHSDGKSWVLVKPEPRLVFDLSPGAASAPEIVELVSLLNLKPGETRYELQIVAGGVPDPARHPSEPSTVVRLMPRATAQVYIYLANGVEVPAEHFASGLVRPMTDAEGHVFDPRTVTAGIFAVHACKGHQRPACAYQAVKYRDHWYYIDDRDQATKESFGLVLLLNRVDFKRQRLISENGPTLTLPVGGR